MFGGPSSVENRLRPRKSHTLAQDGDQRRREKAMQVCCKPSRMMQGSPLRSKIAARSSSKAARGGDRGAVSYSKRRQRLCSGPLTPEVEAHARARACRCPNGEHPVQTARTPHIASCRDERRVANGDDVWSGAHHWQPPNGTASCELCGREIPLVRGLLKTSEQACFASLGPKASERLFLFWPAEADFG